MAIINYTYFDVHEYIKKAMSFGINKEFAELNARVFEQITETQIQILQQLSEIKAKNQQK